MVIAKQGIAATSQVLASQAAAQILSQGGAVADAAIAANAVLGVVEVGGVNFAGSDSRTDGAAIGEVVRS